MSDTLRNQLNDLQNALPIVQTNHYVLLQRTDQGPVAFLLERTYPANSKPEFRMETVVQPEYQARLYVSRKNRLVHKASRTRFKFTFRKPRKNVTLPGDVKCPKQSKMIKLVDRLYDRLRAHDSNAWEEVLGDLLDIPSNTSSGGKG